MNILVIGALTAADSDPRISGTAILLKHLIAGLQARPGIKAIVIDIGEFRKSKNRLLSFCLMLKKIWVTSKNTDTITLHLSPNGFSIIAFPLMVMSKLRKQPVIFRMFGGREIEDIGFLLSHIAYWCLARYDQHLAETKRLVNIATQRGITHTTWYPNSRPLRTENIRNPQRRTLNRVIFLAQVRLAKGILELIEASDLLIGITKVDVYGPFHDGLDESIFVGHPNVEYHGVVAPEDVDDIFTNGIALVLPSYLVGEGYPGAVIEAFNAGLPIVSTTWCSIPEIVDETCGILVEPKNPQALADAIRALVEDPSLWTKLSNGAYEHRFLFDQDTAVNSFIDVCKTQVEKRRASSA